MDLVWEVDEFPQGEVSEGRGRMCGGRGRCPIRMGVLWGLEEGEQPLLLMCLLRLRPGLSGAVNPIAQYGDSSTNNQHQVRLDGLTR